MKKFTMLFSALAVTATAFAGSPVAVAPKTTSVDLSVSKVSKAQMNPAVQSRAVKNVEVLNINRPKKAPAASVSYKSPEGVYGMGLSEDYYMMAGSGYGLMKAPAYTELTWVNTSNGFSDFEWEYEYRNEQDSLRIATFEGTDLVRSEPYDMFYAPTLRGVDESGNVSSYTQFNEKNPNIYFYGGSTDFGQGEFGITSYTHWEKTSRGFYGVECMGFGPGLQDLKYSNGKPVIDYNPISKMDSVYNDPVFKFSDPQFGGYINCFDKPAAPFTITKMWTPMNLKVNKATKVTLDLYKINDEGKLTDELIASGVANVALPDSTGQSDGMLVFDLFCIDEDGLETDDPIVITTGFYAFMTFVNDDIDMVIPVSLDGAQYVYANGNPYQRNAFIVIKDGENEDFLGCPLIYGLDAQFTTVLTYTDFLWMFDACFPWTFALEGVDKMHAPNEGATLEFFINSYFQLRYFDYTIPDDCDWIDLETAEVGTNKELGCQYLKVPVAALPEGVKGRSATIHMELYGSSLDLTITQGEVDDTAVGVVAADKNVEYFDLAGRRVLNPEKGIYIKKSANKSEKVVL